MLNITEHDIESFRTHLTLEERAAATIQKYVRDAECLRIWLAGDDCDREAILRYKQELMRRLAPTSVNATLASLNSFFSFLGKQELRVRSLRIQRQLFLPSDRELTREEYGQLLDTAATHDRRLCLLLQTVCSTGIRISELRFITVEAITSGVAEITGKGKHRQVFLPVQLCELLRPYVQEQALRSGSIFITSHGLPLDRSNIWSAMKRMARLAGVSERKVFPHNLRHLFARTYYSSQKDILRLADILGHTNVNTTRIYTIESGEIHREQLQNLGLLREDHTT